MPVTRWPTSWIWFCQESKEMSTNNRYRFAAILIVFLGFSLNKLQRLFSAISKIHFTFGRKKGKIA